MPDPPTSKDVFERDVVKTTTPELEIASHYEYNPERLRLFVNGSRAFPEYGSVSQYTHDGHNHELSPAVGDTVVLETNERPRYTVQFEMAATWAFSLSQSLQSGDQVKVGLFDGTDGWHLEHNPGHADDEADLVILNQGTEQLRKEGVDIKEPVTAFARLLLRTAWYDISRNEWERSYPNPIDSEQENPVIARTSLPKKRGPQVGNLPLRFEVTAGSGTSNLTLNAGSCALVTYGARADIVREKVHNTTATIGTSGTWVPIYAMRVDPTRDITNVQLKSLSVKEFSASADVALMAASVAPSKTDANFDDPDADGVNEGPRAPVEQSPTNSVLQETFSVSTFPDSTGTAVTSASNPGGYQIGYGSLYTSGTGASRTTTGGGKVAKRILSSRDVAVVLANAGATGDVSFEATTEQDW